LEEETVTLAELDYLDHEHFSVALVFIWELVEALEHIVDRDQLLFDLVTVQVAFIVDHKGLH